MVVYLICYAASYFLAGGEHYLLSGAALILAALWLYISDYRKSRNLIHLRALFSGNQKYTAIAPPISAQRRTAEMCIRDSLQD